MFCQAFDGSFLCGACRRLACKPQGFPCSRIGLRRRCVARLPGLQFPKGDPYEREPTPLFKVAPMAIAFGIGEAF